MTGVDQSVIIINRVAVKRGGEIVAPDKAPVDGTTREQILGYIKEHPGVHLRQIQREMNLAMGVIQYHLYGLEKERKILSRRSGLYKRFYASLTFGENQEAILDVLSQETERDLLLFIIENPGTNQKKISEYARISASSVNWHMKRMIGSGLVKPKHEGQFVRYEITGEKKEILSLVRSFHPSLWENWADRLTNAINEISPETDVVHQRDSKYSYEYKKRREKVGEN